MSASLTRDGRAEIARRLQDGVAQTLVALALQITAAANECADPATADRLVALRALAGAALEETCRLAYSVHPPPHGDPLRPVLRPRAAE